MRYSLKTGSLREAGLLARMAAGRVQELFGRLRMGDSSMSELTKDQINQLVRSYMLEVLEFYEEQRVNRRKPLTEKEDELCENIDE